MKNFIRVPAVNFIFNRYGYASDTRDHAIELRIQHRGEKTIFSTGIRVYKRQWDKKNQLVVNRADAVEINKLLEQMRQNVLKIIYAMVEEGNIDIKGIPSRLKALERPKESFVDYCQRRAEVHMHGLKKRRFRPFPTSASPCARARSWRSSVPAARARACSRTR